MTILSPNITNYVPFCRPGLLLRDQQGKGQRNAQPQGKSEGKRQRGKETRGRNRGLACLLPLITPQSDLGMCPIEVGRNRGEWDWGQFQKRW